MERSLDQLKRLDDLPVDEQLATASTLCNHAHRADMIIKWLLPKLSQYHTQQAWQLLTKCVRLIQPTLLPSRLKGSALLEAMIEEPLPAMDDTLTTILSIQPQILAVESSLAARFFAVWAPENINTALQVWELRRSSNDEDFVNHCLLPAARLYSQVSKKRQRDTYSQVNQLERLIAKHVFVKSRAAFLKHQDMRITQQLQNLDQTVFPALLSIAIRCGSVNTQRQMLQEIAWNDVVFNTLAEQSSLETILSMLDVIKERSTLSVETFQRLLSTHFEWSLIIKIVAINPRVFSNLDRLYDAIAEDCPTNTRDLVLLPIMRTFAQDRKLPEFLDLWQGQVERSSIWLDLDDAPENLLEEHLTSQQIIDLLKARLESTQGSTALYVVTSAIIRGINNAETLDTFAPIAEATYEQLADYDTPGFWTLALRLHDICVPQKLHSKLFAAASKRSCGTGAIALEAALFAARLCQIHGEAQGFLHKLVKASPAQHAVTVLIRYPSLILSLDKEDYKRVVKVVMAQEQPSTVAAFYEAAKFNPDVARFITRLVMENADFGLAQQLHLPLSKDLRAKFFGLAASEDLTINQLVLIKSLLGHASSDELAYIMQRAGEEMSQPILSHYLAAIEAATKYSLAKQGADGPKRVIYDVCSSIHLQVQLLPDPYMSMLGPTRMLSVAVGHIPDLTEDQQLHMICDNLGRKVLRLLESMQHSAATATAASVLLEICSAISHCCTGHAQDIQRLAALVFTKYTTALSLPILHPAVHAYRLMCQGDSDIVLLAHAASRSLPILNPVERTAILTAFSQAVKHSQATIIQSLLSEEITSSALVIAKVTMLSLPKDTELSPILLHVINSLHTLGTNTIKMTLQFLDASIRVTHINQHIMEEMLNAVHALTRPSDAEPLVYPELCNILTTLLKRHRARLNGRFHILLPVLQALMSRLFMSKLSLRHAQAYTRVLTLLCAAPQVKHRKDSLVDRTRRTRAQAGSFITILLHTYCSLSLRSAVPEGLSEALRPGLWAMMDAMQISNNDSLKILSSAMTNNERAILRGIAEQWRDVGRWTGR